MVVEDVDKDDSEEKEDVQVREGVVGACGMLVGAIIGRRTRTLKNNDRHRTLI